MVAKEFVTSEANDYGFQGFDDDDREETLSLCDLAAGSNAEDYYWSEFSYKDDHEDTDFFEFSSEDFTSASSMYPKPNQNIIFCGKLIPYKGELEAVPHHDHQTQNQNSTLDKNQSPKRNRIFASTCKKESRHRHESSCDSLRYDFSVKKVSTTSATTVVPGRSKWYLLAFGSFGKGSALSKKMELRDIRSRQSRRRVAEPSTTVADFGRGDHQKRSESKGLWRLLRILGSKSKRTNAVVKASFGCVPNVWDRSPSVLV